MSGKLHLTKPTFIMLYGFPGAGKTYLARQLCETINAAHVQADRIRHQLFEEPLFDAQENMIVKQITDYMTSEFLHAGISVVFDTNAMRLRDRRLLRDMARKMKAEPVLIWLQIDHDSSFARASKRDRRKADDKFAAEVTEREYEEIVSRMQNPDRTEDYIVVSGKHNFKTQRSAIIKRLYDMGLISSAEATSNVTKPGLVNLIPKRQIGRVDMARRNINIR